MAGGRLNKIKHVLLLLFLSAPAFARVHPSLLNTQADWTAMIASSTIHPWADVISGATMYLSGSQATTRYDCVHMPSNFGSGSNGVRQQNANAFMNLMGSYGLEYVLNTTNSSSTTWRNRITCLMDEWPAMVNEQPISDDYNLSVPYNGAFVNMVLAYDNIYNDLSAVQISSYNVMMDSWTAYNRNVIEPASSWNMSPHGAMAVWSVFRDTDAAQIALDTACYHVDLLGNEQIYPPAVCGNRQAYHDLSSEVSVAQLNRDGVSGSGATYAWARVGGESREKLAKWITKDIMNFTGKDTTFTQTPSFSTRPLLSLFYDWLFTFTITPWNTKVAFGDTANNQSSGDDNFQALSTIYGHSIYLLSNAWLAAGKYSPYAEGIAQSAATRIATPVVYPGELVDYASITSSVSASIIPTRSLAIRNGGAAFWDEDTSSQTLMGVLDNSHLTRGDHYHHYDFNGLFLTAYGVEMLSNPGNGASTQGGVGGLTRLQTQCDARYGNVLLMGNTNFANAPYNVNYGGASGVNCNSFWNWNPFITGTQNLQYVGNNSTPLFGGDGITESLISSKFDYAVGLATGPYVYFDTSTGVTTQFLGQNQRSFMFVHADTATSVNGYWVVDDEVISASYTTVNQIWHPYGVTITTITNSQEYSWDIFPQLQRSTQTLTVFLASPPASVLFSTSAFADGGPQSVSGSNGNYLQANYLNGTYAVHASSAHILTVLYPSDQTGHNKSTFTRVGSGEAEGVTVLSGATTDYFMASNATTTITMQGASFIGKIGFMRKNSGTTQFFVRQGTTFDDGSSPRYGFDSASAASIHLNNNRGSITTSSLSNNTTFYFRNISGVLVDGVSASGVIGTNKFTALISSGFHTLSLQSIIVSSTTGDWGSGSTWIGGVVPGDGDTVSIFHTVSVTDTRYVGTSLGSGGSSINLNSTGTIHITSTGHLIQRGYGTYTAGASNLTDAVDVDGGGAWEFDASASTSPTTLHYSFFPSGTSGFRKFKISGSSSAYASIYNTVASTTAALTENGQASGAVYELLYASVTRMSFDLAYNNGGSLPVKWDAQHSSFTNCGIINASAGGNMESSSTFRHEYNYHQNSWGTSIFNLSMTSKREALGTRSIKGNIFDIKMTPAFGLGDFIIRDNFMGAGFDTGSASFTLFTNNFIRMTQANVTSGANGAMSDSYAWWDDDQQNARAFTTTVSSEVSMSGMIWGMSGRGRASGADDSGEFWLPSGPGRVSTMSITNSIFLANGAGYQSIEIASMLGSASTSTYLNNRLDVEHNTYFGGWDNGNSALPPFAAIDFSETSNMGPGTIDSFRSNILWNVRLSTMPAQFFKTLDVGNVSSNLATGFGTGPTQDVCAPARCDYNAAFVALSTATGPNTSTYTNQGRGYAGKYSATPGAHDVDGQNPNFVDYRRYVEAFDSKYWRPYFGLAQPAAWLSAASYSQGTVVSHSSSTYYWGDTLNYVYIDSGSCAGANPEPGVIPVRNWNKCWKFQSIEDIKRAIISSTTFTDSTIGATNASVNQTLLKWIRAGYAPTNIAYHGTAHDGGDIGAVSVGNPGNPIVSPSTPVVTVGGTIQFITTNSVTWSLTSGSAGSINSSGLYTAPTTYFTASNISPAGCPFRPNDDIVNTRIDNLPVDANSVVRFNHSFAIDGGSVSITFEPSMPTNIYNSGTPLQSMNFRSTIEDNGPFPLLSSSTRMEEGSSIANDPSNNFQDHHILGVDSNTCLASEMYGYYPTGADSGAPASNAGAGFQYATNGYRLPDRTNSAGGTDAAGMAIQPLLLRFSELKSGRINHALRMTLNNQNLYNPSNITSAQIWPATNHAYNNFCTDATNCFPYGARLRVKSTFNCGAFSSPGSQTICIALQRYGAFLVDGSSSKFAISANYDVTEDTASFRDIFTLLQSSISQSQLEQVDESSLMVSSFTGVVNPVNAYVTPANFAQAIATNILDGSTRTINIALQPVTVGWSNPAYQGLDSGINVMAGTPLFQIPYWVNGATDTAATCSMSPTIGTLTSDCKYTAPSSQYNQIFVTTVTITSHIDPNHATSSFFMTIFSSDAIRVRMGPPISSLDTIPPYDSNGNYQDPTTGGLYFEEPANMMPNWYTRSTQGSVLWPSQLFNNFSYGASDKVFSAMAPPGTYSLQLNTGAGACCGDVALSSNSFETQGLVFQSTVTLAPAIFVPRIITTTLSVGLDKTFYWAIRGNVANGNHNFMSFFSLLPSSISRTTQSWQGTIKMQGNILAQ